MRPPLKASRGSTGDYKQVLFKKSWMSSLSCFILRHSHSHLTSRWCPCSLMNASFFGSGLSDVLMGSVEESVMVFQRLSSASGTPMPETTMEFENRVCFRVETIHLTCGVWNCVFPLEYTIFVTLVEFSSTFDGHGVW